MTDYFIDEYFLRNFLSGFNNFFFNNINRLNDLFSLNAWNDLLSNDLYSLINWNLHVFNDLNLNHFFLDNRNLNLSDDLYYLLHLNYLLHNHFHKPRNLDYLFNDTRNTHDLLHDLFNLDHFRYFNDLLYDLFNNDLDLLDSLHYFRNFHDLLDNNFHGLFLNDIFENWLRNLQHFSHLDYLFHDLFYLYNFSHLASLGNDLFDYLSNCDNLFLNNRHLDSSLDLFDFLVD